MNIANETNEPVSDVRSQVKNLLGMECVFRDRLMAVHVAREFPWGASIK